MIGGMQLGPVKVMTTHYRGHSPEEIAQLALDKIIYIGQNSHPMVIAQAEAFKDQIHGILVKYLTMAQQEERTTICAKLTQNGFEEIAKLVNTL